MLIRISVVTDVVIKIIYISQKQIAFRKNKRTTHINSRKTNFFGVLTAYTSLSS